jgi:hypothetical protein
VLIALVRTTAAATGTSDLAAVARLYARCGHDNEESRASGRIARQGATPDENAVVMMGSCLTPLSTTRSCTTKEEPNRVVACFHILA